ncbi:hypothetical protein MAP00_002391 [Monascus purpureus]|nr:hypothetical protein MAP00_002391 [Monascus purpureus]
MRFGFSAWWKYPGIARDALLPGFFVSFLSFSLRFFFFLVSFFFGESFRGPVYPVERCYLFFSVCLGLYWILVSVLGTNKNATDLDYTISASSLAWLLASIIY